MRFVIDSTCDIDQVYIDKLDIKVIPLQVIIEGKSYRDKKEITVEEVYSYIQNGTKLQTSLPLISDFLSVFEPLAEAGEPFIYLAFSKELSGTFNAGHLVLSELKEKYPQMKYAQIDSKSGALGYGVVALEMIMETERNSDFDHIVKYTTDLTNKIEHVFMVNNLDQLSKGGRISQIKAIIGGLLSIRPILRLVDGKIHAYKSAIGTKRAFKELVNHVEKTLTNKDSLIGINYSNSENLANQIEIMLRHVGYTNFIREQIGSVFASHIGLDAVGLYYFRD